MWYRVYKVGDNKEGRLLFLDYIKGRAAAIKFAQETGVFCVVESTDSVHEKYLVIGNQFQK